MSLPEPAPLNRASSLRRNSTEPDHLPSYVRSESAPEHSELTYRRSESAPLDDSERDDQLAPQIPAASFTRGAWRPHSPGKGESFRKMLSRGTSGLHHTRSRNTSGGISLHEQSVDHLALGRTAEAPRADSGGLPKVPTPLTPLKELEVEVPAAPAAAPPGAFLNSASCEELLSDVAAAALEESTSEGSAYRRTSLGKGMRTSKAL